MFAIIMLLEANYCVQNHFFLKNKFWPYPVYQIFKKAIRKRYQKNGAEDIFSISNEVFFSFMVTFFRSTELMSKTSKNENTKSFS